MTIPRPLEPLHRRLAAGATKAARRALAEEINPTSDQVGTTAVRTLLGGFYHARYAALTPNQVTDRIERLSQALAADRVAILSLLLNPAAVLDALPTWLSGRDAAGDDVDAWLGLCWLAEAAWRVVHHELPGPDFAPGDHALLVPLAARLRFVALTEPMRHRGDPAGLWAPDAAAAYQYGPHGICSRVFGAGSWNTFVGRCREARRAWRDILRTYQSHPYLASASPGLIDDDLALLAFNWSTAARGWGVRRLGSPLVLSVLPVKEPAPLTAEDSAALDDVTDRHLLPRFELGPVIALAAHDDNKALRSARRLMAGLVVALALAAVVAAELLHARGAAELAAACYGLIGAGTVAFGTRWAAPWLLRLPAASAVGLLALVSFFPQTWLTTPRRTWWAVIILVLLAAGYLVVETRNHGATAAQAVRRSGVVLVIGAVHATLVTLIGLVVVAPAFVAGGNALGRMWLNPDGFEHGGKVLALGTAWCLATGVLSQILWDDRPVTAPLAHLSWRSSEPPG
jgi:hypothetical protein